MPMRLFWFLECSKNAIADTDIVRQNIGMTFPTTLSPANVTKLDELIMAAS